MADIGTGAGFPGLALKIVLPQSSVTLIDSLRKRVDFLTELIGKLQLSRVQAVHSRAEDLPKNVLYDTVVARAVSQMRTLAEYCLPFVSIGGTFIAYKAENCEEEVKAALPAVRLLGGELTDIKKVCLPYGDAIRSLVCIQKVRPTPLSYPRGGNKPKKQPL